MDGVIGGGVLGLTAALRLAQRGYAVIVLERGDTPGGLASSFEVAPGIWLERFYHHIFRTDRRAIALLRTLGLEERLEWHRPVTAVMVDGEVRQLDSAASLMRLSVIPMASRLRMAAAIAFLRILPTARPLEGSAAGAWMRRACGETGFEAVWNPLLKAKFGKAAPDVSMAWLWARIHDRTPRLGYLRGGFHQLYMALTDAIERSGGQVILGAEVLEIARQDGGVAVRWRAGDVEHDGLFERVISTLAPETTARLASLPVPAGSHPTHPKPLAAQCLVLSLDRPLTGTYWIGGTDPAWPFMAVVEHTALIPPTSYGGTHLLYLGAYRPSNDPLLRATTDELIGAAAAQLAVLNPAFEPAWIDEAWVFTAPDAQPIVDTGYRKRLTGFTTAMPGLFAASMFQVYPHDRGQNYSIELAERLVAALERAR